MKTDLTILRYETLVRKTKALQRQGKKMVLTTGYYDLLHLGYVIHFAHIPVLLDGIRIREV